MRAILIAAILVCSSVVAFADHEVDCDLVRSKVAEHGRAAAIKWARSQGYGWREIWRIKKQCGV